MTGRKDDDWTGLGPGGRRDHDAVLRRLGRAAGPGRGPGGRPLHHAAAFGGPEAVAEPARRATDVDALSGGRTALWEAVLHDRPDSARALAAAGADPWRPVMGGWSPGRLSLAGPAPDLFAVPEGQGLTEAEQATVREGRRLVAALGELYSEGTGLACVAGIGAEEAVRRLEATPVTGEDVEGLFEDEDEECYNLDASLAVVGVTTVPGGCVVTQPWGYAPNMPGVQARLSAGTVCYGLYANPKSGNQGSITRDGVHVAGDLHPGGGPDPEDTSWEVLASYLFRHNAVAYSCAFAGLRLTDARPVVGPPDMWVELPERAYQAG